MSNISLIPRNISDVPRYMRPNKLPWAIMQEGYLTKEQCESIVNVMMAMEEYQFMHCNAITRESSIPIDKELTPIAKFCEAANQYAWEFILDPNPVAWMQTYFSGHNYQKHADGTPGQSRKVTAVALLTDESKYTGGELVLDIASQDFIVPKTQGTIVVFPAWVLHEVHEVTSGIRQTINLGYWGPFFK